MAQTKSAANQRELGRGLKSRHLAMISLGGVIGVGMFLGSGATVKLAGPAVVVAYALGGVLMLLVMLALAEMSVARAAPGSFKIYAQDYLGPYAGFVTGWLYWFSWVATMAAEIVAATTYLDRWVPHSISPLIAFGFAIVLTWVNLQRVESFGEFEFWFSLIKVLAIVAFIIVGGAAIFGLFGLAPIGSRNYLGHGGLLPNGLNGLLLSSVMVMSAYAGTEVIGIAAGESEDPARDVPRAINGIVVRTLVIYIGSMLVLVGTVPWTEVGLTGSPFVTVFQMLGLPYVPELMNLVVITAALSSMNSGLYTSSRMLYSLAQSGEAPAFLRSVNPRTRSPGLAVIASTAFLYVGVLAYYLLPEQAFLWIVSVAVFGFLFSWLIIVLTHLAFRPRVEREQPELLRFRAPWFPWGSRVAAVLILAVIGAFWFIPEQRLGLIAGLAALSIMTLYWFALAGRHVARQTDHLPAGLQMASFFGLSTPPKRR